MAKLTKKGGAVRKVSKNWYRLTLDLDEWDFATSVIDIIRNEFNEWVVVDADDIGVGDRADVYNHSLHFTFTLLRNAKAFAQDLRIYIDSEYASELEPKIFDDKYDK